MKNSVPKNIIMFQLIFVLFERFLIQLGISSSCIYLIDIGNIYLLVKLILNYTKIRKFNKYILLYLIFFVLVLCDSFINYGNYGYNFIFTFLEIRNLIRFPIFLLSVYSFMTIEDVDRLISLVNIHFITNSIFIIYEYLTYFPENANNMRGDLLNGFFGNMRGGNSFVNVELLFIVLVYFSRWHKGKCSTFVFISKLGLSLLISFLIELKVFVLEILLLYILYLIICKKTIREIRINYLIIILLVILFVMGYYIMIKEYPAYRDFYSIRGISENIFSSNYSNNNDYNRITGILSVSKNIFECDLIKILFGIGLGNGSTSYFLGKTTFFAEQYYYTHYSWFQGLFLFVQCGATGLAFYIYLLIYLFNIKKNSEYDILTYSMIIISVILVFYGDALKTDAGYLVYAALAIGFVNNFHEQI